MTSLAMPNVFKLSLEITRKDTNENVSHKIDGQLFGHTNTVKLNVNTAYDVIVTFRPALKLLKLLIHGENQDLEVVKGRGEENCVYSATYRTDGHDRSKKGVRKEVPLVFQLENGLTLKTQLQCKFYDVNETEHSKWGNKLTSIEYECCVSNGNTFVSVTKERYL